MGPLHWKSHLKRVFKVSANPTTHPPALGVVLPITVSNKLTMLPSQQLVLMISGDGIWEKGKIFGGNCAHEPELLRKLSALVKLRGTMAFFFPYVDTKSRVSRAGRNPGDDLIPSFLWMRSLGHTDTGQPGAGSASEAAVLGQAPSVHPFSHSFVFQQPPPAGRALSCVTSAQKQGHIFEIFIPFAHFLF